jgi:chorismate mutase
MADQIKTRGVRGAVTVNENSYAAIEKATIELLEVVLKKNTIKEEDISSVIFTMTDDLNAVFPAKIARIHFGWDNVPMICTHEIPVPGSLPMCIRILITINTTLQQNQIKHVYLAEAAKLRPDLANSN